MRRQISISLLLAALIASLTSSPAAAVDTRTCAQGGICAVGDVGPGGGVVFYARVSGAFTDSYSNQFDDGDDGLRTYTAQVDMTSSEVVALTFDYLEFAPSSGFTSLKQASADGLTVTFSKFGTGQTNTSAFLADFPGDNGTNNASHWANNYAANGYQDWFLPSTDELALLLIRHLKGQLGSSSPLSGNYYQAWTSENGIIFLSSPSQIVMSFGKNSTDQNFVIPIRAFSSTPAPAPTTTPTPTTSAAPVVATVAKVSASSKIKFDRSSSVLTKASKAKLKKLAKTVGADAEIKVQAAVGPLNNASKAQMRALAKLRAKAIAKYLKSQISMNQTYKIKIIDEGLKPVTSVTAN